MSTYAASETPSAEVFAPNTVADKVKTAIANGLSQVADVIEQKAKSGQTPEPLANYARQASDLLDASADYVRSIDPGEVKQEIETRVRANPGRTLLIAAAVGLLLGIVIRRGYPSRRVL